MALTFDIEGSMQLEVDYVVGHHTYNNVFYLYYVQNNNLYRMGAPTPLGDFTDLQFAAPELLVSGFNFNGLVVHRVQRDQYWFVFETDGDIWVAPYPDPSPPYLVDDPYRLYYATDTEKLYMNINQQWQFIGSLHHTLLYNIGIKTHEQLESKIALLEQRIDELEGGGEE